MISEVDNQAMEPWIAARDAAVLTLLYGCGLRISEALGLARGQAPLPEVLRIIGKGRKERIVPVLPAAREAVLHDLVVRIHWDGLPEASVAVEMPPA